MTRIIHAELIRLLRKRTLIALGLGSLAFSAIAAVTIFASAKDTGGGSRQGGTTLAALAGQGGGTEAFAVAASFVGFLVFVTFIALIGTEFSGGTFRAVLLRDPRRLRVIVGKLAGILLVAAGLVALTELLTLGLSLALAPGQDVATSEWFSLASLGDGLRDFLTVFAGVVGWAVFGTTLAAIVRSVPLALGLGLAWVGPLENITVDSWSTGYRVFPGQVLGSLIRGGTTELGLGRALATAALYTGVAAVATLFLVTRRDVTS